MLLDHGEKQGESVESDGEKQGESAESVGVELEHLRRC